MTLDSCGIGIASICLAASLALFCMDGRTSYSKSDRKAGPVAFLLTLVIMMACSVGGIVLAEKELKEQYALREQFLPVG